MQIDGDLRLTCIQSLDDLYRSSGQEVVEKMTFRLMTSISDGFSVDACHTW